MTMAVPMRMRQLRGRLALAIAASLGALMIAAGPSAVGRQAAGSSHPGPSESGIYTLAQAERGESTYLDECARCHAETLGGTEFGPAVVGEAFIERWAGKSVGELFTLIRETMPADGAGRLSAARIADVVAFLLKANGIPSGGRALASDVAALKGLQIPRSDSEPARELPPR